MRSAGLPALATHSHPRPISTAAQIPDDPEELVVSEEMSEALEILWSDPACPMMMDEEGSLSNRQIEEAVDVFMNRWALLRDPEYLPSDEDILQTRWRTRSEEVTSKIMSLQVGDAPVSVIDLGGQTSERANWSAHFEDSALVVFVVALDDWNKSMMENQERNRLDDALELFTQICECPFFKDTPILLFLNKVDRFAGKIFKVNFKQTFPDFNAGKKSFQTFPSCVDEDYFVSALKYIGYKFERVSAELRGKDAVVHMSFTSVVNPNVFKDAWLSAVSTPLKMVTSSALPEAVFAAASRDYFTPAARAFAAPAPAK
jgi:hypothetical protein